MKKYRCLFLYCFLFPALISCKKYLDVQPEDRFLSEQVFKDRALINATLNGIYLNLAKSNLYGAQLSWKSLDLMAQYYRYEGTNPVYGLYANYQYAQPELRSAFSGVWESAYRTILNANTFIGQLEKTTLPVDKNQKDILLGEAYAIRAYLHFDMLRLFGPVYNSADSLKQAIPYNAAPGDQVNPVLPANKVMDNILADLNTAQVLLENDPVRKEGVQALTGADPNGDFYRMRNHRFNYYAVMAVKARVLLYRQDKAGALKVAKAVLNEAAKYFPFTPEAASQPDSPNPDRVFSSEIILGIENPELYQHQRDYFADTQKESEIFVPLAGRLEEVYEQMPNDYRYRVNWAYGLSSGKPYKTFVKYKELGVENPAYNFQALFRLSELYYIAAECEPDQTEATRMLNTVRANRGLPNLDANADIGQELYKEYRKEFWGEGQTFFFFKRIKLTDIPSGGRVGANKSISLTDYVVPLPLVEIQNR